MNYHIPHDKTLVTIPIGMDCSKDSFRQLIDGYVRIVFKHVVLFVLMVILVVLATPFWGPMI